ncbi:MAG TPA: hypothetical protein VIN08_16910 [Ohtaekwangia sp.]|uniref:hypothetical protein n=1 Tax=Ohtaekwangia sp. TaxID=2066019 RepID=UPI002F948543
MDCVDIIEYSTFQKLLADHHKDPMRDFDYQMETNHAFIYKLNTGQIVLFPSFPSADPPKCLVFRDQGCFDAYVSEDRFPIENYDKQLEDHDTNRLKNIGSNISYYQGYLNNRYKFNFIELNRETIQSYYLKVSKDEPGYPLTVIALGALMGEQLRIELNGKWVIKKNYGPYNPYYSPLVRSDDKVFPVYDKLYSMIESKAKDSSGFFDRRFFGSIPLKVFEDAGVRLIEL